MKVVQSGNKVVKFPTGGPLIIVKFPKYGYLYNGYAITSENGLAPTGWHPMTGSEWTTLKSAIGYTVGSPNANTLKSARTATGSPNVGVPTDLHPRWDWDADDYGTDTHGLSLLPGGCRDNSGNFASIGQILYAFGADIGSPTYNTVYYNSKSIFGGGGAAYSKYGYSVRCVRDNDTGWREGDIIKDIDGNTYHTVKIGSLIYTVESLATTKYNNGTTITKVTDSGTWSGLTTEAYCSYNNDESYVFY